MAEKILRETQNGIMGKLRNFITENFLSSTGLDAFENNDSFMEKGIIDSTGILELLEFIEEEFHIRVEDEEIIPDNLDSVDKITSFISRKSSPVSE